MRLQGSCHCRAVRFSVQSNEPMPFMRCYGSICRKTAGSGGFAINLGAEFKTLKVKGREHLGVYRARLGRGTRRSPAERHFCELCGTSDSARSHRRGRNGRSRPSLPTRPSSPSSRRAEPAAVTPRQRPCAFTAIPPAKAPAHTAGPTARAGCRGPTARVCLTMSGEPIPCVTTDARVDAYIGAAQPFARPILICLRALVHGACPGVEEDIKWGMPAFMYRGRILAHMAAFKAHCAFGFSHGKEVVDLGLGGRAMGQFGRIAALGNLPPKPEMAALVKKAAALIDAGAKPPRAGKSGAADTRGVQPEKPADLAAALRRSAAARRFYDGLASGHQREYVAWITEAKRDDTRQRRVAQTVAWLAEGKRRHWKYEDC
jgi:uncharacterized protein YdeI (YjbR/CyaY-like superfamily)